MRTRIVVLLLPVLLAGMALSANAQKESAPAPDPIATAVSLQKPVPPAGRPDVVAPTPGGENKASTTPHDAQNSRFDLMSMLFVFMLSTFIGLQVISRVSRLLHTPLMSLTNAISAIAVVGAIIVTGAKHPPYITILGAIALFASMTNIVSGFLITDRMLKMFKRKENGK
jgi:H+-translocating NAD(P) transhydrogenase subunit alpha